MRRHNKTGTEILCAASEARPFIASGGLADIAESLPKVLNKKEGIDCRVVLPLYSGIPDDLRERIKYVTHFYLQLSWRNQYCGIFEAEDEGVTYYFIDNEQYYKRDKLYGYPDDDERFAFFSLAILEMLPRIGFRPDIIHAHDWQTALVPIYRHVSYAHIEFYASIKTVFTIHNITHQGKTDDFKKLGDLFGLPLDSRNIVEYAGKINLLKGAIETSHATSTVSPTYSNEIAGFHSDTSEYDFGEGLTPLIKEKSWKLTGILNGLDSAGPISDKCIYVNYGISDAAEGKAKNKLELQKSLGLEQRANVPLISIVTRIDSKQKGCQHVLEVIKSGLLEENDAQFVLLGEAARGDTDGEKMEGEFKELGEKRKGKMSVNIEFLPELGQKIYASSDIFLMPSLYEPCGLTQMISLKFGTIPVVRETGGLSDTIIDVQYENGNGFTYKNYNSKEFRDTIERALLEYKDSNRWNILVKRAMECDFSWDNGSADEYVKLYKTVLN